MLADFFVPPGLDPSLGRIVAADGFDYRAARWRPPAFAELADRLTGAGRESLRATPPDRLLAAWQETVAAFRDPLSRERRRLEAPLATLCRLSPAGLAAGLEAVLGGVADEAAADLFARASARLDTAPGSPVLVILASNLPALAVQPLLPALALARPALVKSPSAEPLFSPAFAAALARREPRLAPSLAAVTWRGGARGLEAPLLSAAGRVLAYGEEETLEDLSARAPRKVFGYGPKTSLAAVGEEIEPREVAAGLARDVALFDQRGCLSVAAVYTTGDARELAHHVGEALVELARRWPPGPVDAAVAASVQQLRGEARMRGLDPVELPLAAGTVVVEPRPSFRPSPGLRTVRIHPLDDLVRLPEILASWRGRLQGVALAGRSAERLSSALTELGITRTAPPGELQSPDASWHNGGVHPLDILSADT